MSINILPSFFYQARRPTINEILNHDFLRVGFIPQKMPTHALRMVPYFHDFHNYGTLSAIPQREGKVLNVFIYHYKAITD